MELRVIPNLGQLMMKNVASLEPRPLADNNQLNSEQLNYPGKGANFCS
jgi:hypothetical protein